MREAENMGYRFPLPNTTNRNFHYKVNQSIVGEIRGGENVCKKIQGYDANSLYPYCMQQFLPVNCWYRRRASESYTARRMDGFNESAFKIEFLTYMNHTHKRLNYPFIKSKYSEGGRDIIILGYRVDGYCDPILRVGDLSSEEVQNLKEQNLFNEMTKPTIYEADGCYFHGCEHTILEHFNDLKTATDDSTKETIADQLRVLLQRRYDTQQKREVLEENGYHVHTITECCWRDKLKTISFNGIEGGDKIKPYLVRKFGTRPEAVTDEIILEELHKPLSPIDGDGLFGFVRCDLEVPEADIESGKWDELAPIFINSIITEKDITEYQQSRLINVSDCPDKPIKFEKKMLIDCVKVVGGNALFSTELLRWYLCHGLIITKIYEVFESCAGKPFDSYMTDVVEDRKKGDKAQAEKLFLSTQLENALECDDPSTTTLKNKINVCDEIIMLGNRAKVDMNSFYGKLLENKSKHEDCFFTHGYIASCIEASKPGLKHHIKLDEFSDIYEIRRCESVITYNMPSYLGLMVLQYAKLHMLKFVYDFLYKWVDPTKVQACQMDTDSF